MVGRVRNPLGFECDTSGLPIYSTAAGDGTVELIARIQGQPGLRAVSLQHASAGALEWARSARRRCGSPNLLARSELIALRARCSGDLAGAAPRQEASHRDDAVNANVQDSLTGCLEIAAQTRKRISTGTRASGV